MRAEAAGAAAGGKIFQAFFLGRPAVRREPRPRLGDPLARVSSSSASVTRPIALPVRRADDGSMISRPWVQQTRPSMSCGRTREAGMLFFAIRSIIEALVMKITIGAKRR